MQGIVVDDIGRSRDLGGVDDACKVNGITVACFNSDFTRQPVA